MAQRSFAQRKANPMSTTDARDRIRHTSNLCLRRLHDQCVAAATCECDCHRDGPKVGGTPKDQPLNLDRPTWPHPKPRLDDQDDDGLVTCDRCPKMFTTEHALRTHQRITHSAAAAVLAAPRPPAPQPSREVAKPSATTAEPGPVVCPVCGKTFKNSSGLGSHRRGCRTRTTPTTPGEPVMAITLTDDPARPDPRIVTGEPVTGEPILYQPPNHPEIPELPTARPKVECPDCHRMYDKQGLGTHRKSHRVAAKKAKKATPRLDTAAVLKKLEAEGDYDPHVLVVGHLNGDTPRASAVVLSTAGDATQVADLLATLGHRSHTFRLTDGT